MKEVIVGEVLRKCRLDRGITQKELCEGICSISTLSRIENGEQHPTRTVFNMLVSRMGEDIEYDEYTGDYDYEVYNLARMAMVYLERNEKGKANICIKKLKYIISREEEGGVKEKCICKFIELLSATIDYKPQGIWTEFIEINQYGYHLYEELKALLKMSGGTLSDNSKLDRIEVRMVNLMGYGLYLSKDYRGAIDIWIKLINGYRDRCEDDIICAKEVAALYCNISAGLCGLGMYDEAEIFAGKGIRYSFEGGGLRLVNKLLINRMYILRQKGDLDKAYKDLALSKAICTCCQSDILREEMIKKLPKTPCLIQIF